jgi:hypothetical protein
MSDDEVPTPLGADEVVVLLVPETGDDLGEGLLRAASLFEEFADTAELLWPQAVRAANDLAEAVGTAQDERMLLPLDPDGVALEPIVLVFARLQAVIVVDCAVRMLGALLSREDGGNSHDRVTSWAKHTRTGGDVSVGTVLSDLTRISWLLSAAAQGADIARIVEAWPSPQPETRSWQVTWEVAHAIVRWGRRSTAGWYGVLFEDPSAEVTVADILGGSQ